MKKNYKIQHGTSTVAYGNMALHTGDSVQEVLNNRERFSNDIGVDPQTWTLLEQTHSLNIIKIDETNKFSGAKDQSPLKDFDALYTRELDVPIGVFTADCIPIIIYDEAQDLICAIHSGWKGSINSFLAIVINYLVEHEQCNPSTMRLYMGPSILEEHFEIKQDIIDLLAAMPFDTSRFISKRDDKFYANMPALNARLANNCGVPFENISRSPLDTYSDGFSYRKDKTINRHLTYIIKKSVE